MNFKKKIILASKSPRRKELLTEMGLDFEIQTADVEENFPEDMPVGEVAEFLAQKKARAAKTFIKNDEIVLGADSVVILGNVIYGKPKDWDDAYRILKSLSGQIHQVVTGVCLLSNLKEISFSEVAKVYFDELTEAEIRYYIDTFKPYDKAGAYAIQEWIGLCKVVKIEGTFSNIKGLPVASVYKHLQQFA